MDKTDKVITAVSSFWMFKGPFINSRFFFQFGSDFRLWLTLKRLKTSDNEKSDAKKTFASIEGEKMKSEVILPSNEMRGKITEYCFYQTLSIKESCGN